MDQLVSLFVVLTMYSSQIVNVADPHQVNQNQCVDVTDLYVTFAKPVTATQTRKLDNCIVTLEERFALLSVISPSKRTRQR